MLRRVLLIVVIVAALVASVVLFRSMGRHRLETNADAARRTGNPIPVGVYVAGESRLAASTPAECVLKASSTIELSHTLRGGVVAEVLAKVGERVTAGQKLARLRDEQAVLAAKSATSRVNGLREITAEREGLVDVYAKSRKDGHVVESEYRRARVDWLRSKDDLATAEIELAKKKQDLATAELKAPVAARVVSVDLHVGSPLQPNQKLITLIVDDPLHLECDLAEEKLGLLEPGLRVTASFFAFPGEAFEGSLARVNPVGDESKRTVTAIVALPNEEGRLLVGLHGVARFHSDRRSVGIPNIALINPGFDAAQVIVVDGEDRARLTQIRIGGSTAGVTEVLDGLSPGDRVVVAGQLGVEDGDALRIISEDGAASANP
jgi:membrane fusion protein (multidrug efflux system)